MDRIAYKFAMAAKAVPAPMFHWQEGADVGIVSLGGCDAAVREAVDRLKAQGIVADYMRIRAFPFDTPVREFLDAHDVTFVVEQNRDAQLRSLLAIETGKPRDEMLSVLDYNGMPLTAQAVVMAVTKQLEGVPA